MEKEKRGGKREGSGRKPREETTTINFRVPKSKAEYLKDICRQAIKNALN